MTEYSHLTIINATSGAFARSSIHQYQMNGWDGDRFPLTLDAGQSIRIEIGFQGGAYRGDDGAEVLYTIAGHAFDDHPAEFAIKARAQNNYRLELDTTELSKNREPLLPNNLGWKKDSELYIWISGDRSGFTARAWWLEDEVTR